MCKDCIEDGDLYHIGEIFFTKNYNTKVAGLCEIFKFPVHACIQSFIVFSHYYAESYGAPLSQELS